MVMLTVTDMMKINDYWNNHKSFHEVDEEDNGKLYFKTDDDESREIENIFWNKLVTINNFNWRAKHLLEENGYKVYIGDGDSFGILVACVEKDNKIFAFG